MITDRAFTPLDRLLTEAQRALDTVFGNPPASRPNPAGDTPDVVLAQVARHGAATEWTRISAREEIEVVATAALAAIGSHTGAAAIWPNPSCARPEALCLP